MHKTPVATVNSVVAKLFCCTLRAWRAVTSEITVLIFSECCLHYFRDDHTSGPRQKEVSVGLQTDRNIAAGCLRKPRWVFPAASLPASAAAAERHYTRATDRPAFFRAVFCCHRTDRQTDGRTDGRIPVN